MSYKALFKPSFFKDLKKLPKSVRERLDVTIENLIKDPFQVRSKKLAGHTNLYRYRLGDYRLVYYLQQHRKQILFLLIAHRKDVYKNLEKLKS